MIVDVAVPFRVAGTFHYVAPPEIASKIQIGNVIEIPFRNQPSFGFVVGFPESTPLESFRIKPIERLVSEAPFFDEQMLHFLKWVSEYYCHPLGEVISTAIPKHSWDRGKRAIRRKPKHNDSLALLDSFIPETLTPKQQEAIEKVLDSNDKRPLLLHGVTGSGKTEVYIRCLQSYLARNLGAIVLVPEISLTPLLVARFSARFPKQVAIWHSHLTPRERADEWDRIRSGDARIVIGARSAVFAPMSQIGCIIVDEEHESSYKQEDELRYHARDIAIVRAVNTGAKVILGSATPSLESYFNSTTGKYAYCLLDKRVEDRPMPAVSIVDLKDPQQKIPTIPWLSRQLDGALKKTFAQKKQAILFLNRLGFAHMLYCDECGYSWRCTNCDIGLTYYRTPRALRCHYCGLNRSVPTTCPECKGTKIDALGFGTEQVENTLRKRYPDARVARMDRSAVTTKKQLETLIQQIAQGDVNLVIGTQMIAKGHDFPGITLVGILMADANLSIPDFRAHERTFQILTQVSGRAGRASDPGDVIIQTFQPDHPIIKIVQENRLDNFYQNELELRLRHRFPPFSRLALVRFQHKSSAQVEKYAKDCANSLLRELTVRTIRCSILGPSEAPIARLRNQYRWHCLLKAESPRELKRGLRVITEFVHSRKSGVQIAFDVDPLNAM